MIRRILAFTFYSGHLKPVFEKAGIEVIPANKKELDKDIYNFVSVNYRNFPNSWKQVTSLILEDEAYFVSKFEDTWENREKCVCAL